MKTFAYIDSGRVAEIIAPLTFSEDVVNEEGEVIHAAGDEVSIDDRYTPEFVAALIDVTDVSPLPTVGMVYDGQTFSAYVPPQPSAADILASNTSYRDQLLTEAALAIAPLQDAVDIDEATDAEKARLTAWKKYRVAVNRVDLTQNPATWPDKPAS